MAKEDPQKSRREQFSQRLKEKYPDREYADDDALFGQISDDYDDYDKQLSGYKSREAELAGLMNKDPRSAQFIADMAQGKDPMVSLIDRMGIDGLKEMLDDPEKKEEFAKRNKEYVERMAKQKSLEAEWQKNMSGTLAMFEQMQKDYNLSDDQIDEIGDWFKNIVNNAVIGKIDRATAEMALKAINHDNDIERASQEGEIRGRNAKIETEMRKPGTGDGTAPLGGGNNAPVRRKRGSIFELADEAN